MTLGAFAWLGLGLLGCGLAACGASLQLQHETVMQRATFDLDCKELQITDLGQRTFGATGCGRKATYITEGPCGGTIPAVCTAVMNSDATRKGEAAP